MSIVYSFLQHAWTCAKKNWRNKLGGNKEQIYTWLFSSPGWHTGHRSCVLSSMIWCTTPAWCLQRRRRRRAQAQHHHGSSRRGLQRRRGFPAGRGREPLTRRRVPSIFAGAAAVRPCCGGGAGHHLVLLVLGRGVQPAERIPLLPAYSQVRRRRRRPRGGTAPPWAAPAAAAAAARLPGAWKWNTAWARIARAGSLDLGLPPPRRRREPPPPPPPACCTPPRRPAGAPERKPPAPPRRRGRWPLPTASPAACSTFRRISPAPPPPPSSSSCDPYMPRASTRRPRYLGHVRRGMRVWLVQRACGD